MIEGQSAFDHFLDLYENPIASPKMEMKGRQTVFASRDKVWRALNDQDTLQRCIPGCQEVTGSLESGFQAVVVQKVGPIKAKFSGAVTIENAVEPERYRIVGEGKGGVAGFAKGAADVALTEVPGGTQLDYIVEAKVGGKIAQLGSRIIDSFAAKMANRFFESFASHLED